MGYYINPKGCSKEEFLAQHGARISPDAARSFDSSGDALPVCLIRNPMFSAAAIGYCPHEVEELLRPEDRRPKTWWSVSKGLLKQFME